MVDIIEGKKATNILTLDMRDLTSLADYYVLCDGSSTRMINAIVDELMKELKKSGSWLANVEGTPESGWMLVDFGSVIVHIFSPEQRAYYQLEELWQEAPLVMRML